MCDMLRPAVRGWHTFDSKGGIVQNIAATNASRLQDVQNAGCVLQFNKLKELFYIVVYEKH